MSPLTRALAVALLALALVLTSSPAPVHAVGTTTSLPADRAQSRGPGGSYEGSETPAATSAVDKLYIRFKVTRDGRRIKKWVVTMSAICASYPPYVQVVVQSMPTMKVKRNGRFRGLFAGTRDGTEYRVAVTGKLNAKKRKVTQGTLSYKVGACQRGNQPGYPLRWTGRRTGR